MAECFLLGDDCVPRLWDMAHFWLPLWECLVGMAVGCSWRWGRGGGGAGQNLLTLQGGSDFWKLPYGSQDDMSSKAILAPDASWPPTLAFVGPLVSARV